MSIFRLLATAFILVLVFLLLGTHVVAGQEEEITVLSQEVEVRFPDDVVFSIEFISPGPIDAVTWSLQIVGRDSSRREPATLDQGETTKAEFILKTRAGSSLFIPPGADVSYSWIIEDTEGDITRTEPETFMYMDTRFEWQVITEGQVSAYYYGPHESRARTILEAATESLGRVGELLETQLTHPIRLIIYDTRSDMVDALPFQSETTQEALVTLGQAYSKERVLLILGSDARIRGTTSHEVTHLLVAQAAEGPGSIVPTWLNEGLAEYGNLDPGYSFDQALALSIETGRLLPITHMTSKPGTPQDIILFYGQSRSIVKFMVDTYGSENLARLLRVINEELIDIDDAMEKVYGFDRVGLDNRWRASIGVPPLPDTADTGIDQPTTTPDSTATPIPTFVPFGARTPTPIIAPSPEITPLRGDLNGDRAVDNRDLVVLRSAYGARAGDSTYLSEADLNSDQKVNYIDLAILGAGYTGVE